MAVAPVHLGSLQLRVGLFEESGVGGSRSESAYAGLESEAFTAPGGFGPSTYAESVLLRQSGGRRNASRQLRLPGTEAGPHRVVVRHLERLVER